MNIDDVDTLSKRYQGGKKKMVTTTPLYFGGYPNGFVFDGDNLAGIDSSFIGCIGDVTVNGKYVMSHCLYSTEISLGAYVFTLIVSYTCYTTNTSPMEN